MGTNKGHLGTKETNIAQKNYFYTFKKFKYRRKATSGSQIITMTAKFMYVVFS